jgi:hypothetical protein
VAYRSATDLGNAMAGATGVAIESAGGAPSHSKSITHT